METVSRPLERENPSPTNSPHSNGSSSNNNGPPQQQHHLQIQTPPVTPRSISSRSETNNPYPTTFVQADTSSFKQVVQMLTGSSNSKPGQSDPPYSKGSIRPIKTGQIKKQGFKLYERRNSLKNGLMISPSIPNFPNNSTHYGFSPRMLEILSPSILDFSYLVFSPVSPLIEDPFNRSSPSMGNSSEEEKATAEKGFYLHPLPMFTPRGSKPQLLPLFPVTLTRVLNESLQAY